jgi:hypothetical protein
MEQEAEQLRQYVSKFPDAEKLERIGEWLRLNEFSFDEALDVITIAFPEDVKEIGK